MRILSQYEIARMTQAELNAMLHHISVQLPHLAQGSHALQCAHCNLHNIRRALAPKPGFGPR